MVAIIASAVVVWLVLFAGWGNFHEIIPPDAMTQDEYVLQYMVVGAIVCLAGAVAASLWFTAACNYDGRGSLKSKYRGLMMIPLIAGVAGMGYLMYLGVGDAGVNSVLTLVAGWLVYINSVKPLAPTPTRPMPPFG